MFKSVIIKYYSMSKARIMGAGSAGSTIYYANVNLKTCGGNKKQGLPFSLDGATYNHRHIKIKATGDKRDVVFTMNQLGGVSSSSFRSSRSHSSGDGVSYKEPYICSPYCVSKGLTNKAIPDVIPEFKNFYITLKQHGIFSYLNYNGIVELFTDTTELLNLDYTTFLDDEGQLLRDWVLSMNFPIEFITNVKNKINTAIQQESMISGNQQLLKKDILTGNYYSTPTMTGFLNGISVCAHLYTSLVKNYPTEVDTCPTRKNILQSGDTFILQCTLNGTTILLNFSME